VLVDPAEEEFLAALPPDQYQQEIASAQIIMDRYADGTLPELVRDMFRSFALRLTADEQLRTLILDAYVSCYARHSQARMVGDEKRLVFGSLPVVRRSRADGTLPDVPVVVLSATTGRSGEQREMWTPAGLPPGWSRRQRKASGVTPAPHPGDREGTRQPPGTKEGTGPGGR
jgi:hypothetical protein